MAPGGLRERLPREFVVRGEAITVRVRESPRARYVRIVVGPRRPLEVIVPRHVSGRDVDQLLERKRAWIERQVAEAQAVSARAARLSSHQSGCVSFGGEPVPIERRNGGRSIAELRHGRLVVAGPDEQAAAAIGRWYRREARRLIGAVAEREADRLGLRLRSISIRDQRTRWGSCSRNGALSFSWRLVLAPRGVLEYVVVHELCHLREPNHSRAFWQLVDEAWPGWRPEARWLRESGAELHAYDP